MEDKKTEINPTEVIENSTESNSSKLTLGSYCGMILLLILLVAFMVSHLVRQQIRNQKFNRMVSNKSALNVDTYDTEVKGNKVHSEIHSWGDGPFCDGGMVLVFKYCAFTISRTDEEEILLDGKKVTGEPFEKAKILTNLVIDSILQKQEEIIKARNAAEQNRLDNFVSSVSDDKN